MSTSSLFSIGGKFLTDAQYAAAHKGEATVGDDYILKTGWKPANPIHEHRGTHIKVCVNCKAIFRELIMDRVEWKVSRR